MNHSNTSRSHTRNLSYSKAKRFIMLFGLVALLIATVLLIYANTKRKNDQLLTTKMVENHLELGRQSFQDTLNSVVKDALFLAQVPGVHEFLGDPANPLLKKRVALGFSALANTRKNYHQLRFINVEGREIIRVNYRQNRATIIATEQLQNKKQRYYFTAGMKLSKDQIYISPLDLNVDHGEIERPFMPMLRVVVPIFDQETQHRGVIVVNYRAEQLLQKFRNALHYEKTSVASDRLGHPIILNKEGDFLLSVDPKDQWGGQLGTGISFAGRYPKIWEEILTEHQGQIVSGRDLFNFITLHLNPKDLPCRKDSSQNCTCSAITLISHQQEVPYLGWQASFRYFPWQLYLILLFFSLPILWTLVSYQHKNKEHQQQLLVQEKRFRLLYEHAPMPYQSLDREGMFLEINSSWLETLGYQRDEVLGRSFGDFLLPEGQASFREAFPRFIKEGKTQGIEFHLRKKDGSTILASFNGRVSRDEQGSFIQTHCIFQDISEQRRDQERISHLSLLRKTGIAIHRQLAIPQESQELLEAICTIFVTEKGYRSAWIVLLDEEQHCKQAANAGLLKDFNLLEQEIAEGNLPPCIIETINAKHLLWEESRQSLCEGCPLANAYPETGLMAAPLLHGGQFYGVLTVSLAAEMVTDSAERELFEEMAKDIAFALFNRAQDIKRKLHEQEIAIRDQISRVFIIHQDNNLYGGILDIVLAALDSKAGIFGYLDGPDMLVCPSMTTSVWGECQMEDKTIFFPREKWGGIWKEVLETGITLYANTPFTVPEGHLVIDNSMATAIISGGKVIGLLQVANKEKDYDEEDKNLLESMAATIAPILQARLEQQWVETKLQDALAEYADLYNNAPDMFVSVEAGTAKVLQCNQTLLSTLGYERAEVIGHPVFKLYHPDCREECRKDVFPTFCRTGTISNRELQLQCKDGSRLPVSLDVSAIRDTNNTIIQSRSICHDISNRKKLEEQMLVTEKMTTIAGLAAGVAHEINTPLSGILQSIQLIEMGLDPNQEQNRALAADCEVDLARVQEYLQKKDLDFFLNGIRDSATTAAHIVADLLQFSRPQDSAPVLVNLEELIKRSIELAKADYSLKKDYNILNVEFIREYSPDQLEVYCMAIEIEQVLINLIKNSCQAMAGESSLQAPHIILRTQQRDNWAVIEVEDNGPGMDEKIRKKIFDPFFTTKDVGKGTGLGLSVAYSIITDKHSGTIRAESTPGEGTRFIIELPMERTEDSNNE